MNVSNSLKEYDVLFLAALVGMNKEEKAQVLDHLAKNMASGALLLLRSAHGARVFLYPVIHPCDLQDFEVLSVFHPTNEVINSIIVARRKSMMNQGICSDILPSKCSEIHGFNIPNREKIIEELTIDEQLS
ncbi:hypothetical protein UlMin_009660 [Ulmus minor]